MPIEVTGSNKSRELIITIDGTFNFSMDQAFRAAYFDAVASNYVLDMRHVQHMDSSALGMLINMRKTLGDDVTISIHNANTQMKRILAMSRLDKKFSIE